MKHVITFLLCVLFSSAIYSQAAWRILPDAPFIPSNQRYDDVFFLNEDLGWAARGLGGRVLKTTDGGETWEEQFQVSDSYFRNIEFLNENIGFLGSLNNGPYSGEFYKTIDGGETWTIVNLTTPSKTICGLDAVGTSTIYGCGAYHSPAYIIKSTDSGETWSEIDMSAYATELVEILFTDENHGYVSGRNSDLEADTGGAIILETNDGGATWTEIYNSGISSEYVWKLQLMEENTYIYGAVESPVQSKLIKSFDSGITWDTKNFPSIQVQAVGFVTPTHGWMGGHFSGFRETTDGGDTWTNLNLGASLNRIFVINEELAYCSGSNLYKYEDQDQGGTLSVLEEASVKSEETVSIVISPMPIEERLNVEVTFAHADNLVLELYDLKGQRIKQFIIDHIESASVKKYSFDFNYPVGTYLLDFHTNNGRRTKKIIKK